MKYLITSDFHIGINENNISFDRHQETIDSLQQIVDICKVNSVNNLIIAGDIFHRSSPSPKSLETFYNFINEIYEKVDNIFLLEGNHDNYNVHYSALNIFRMFKNVVPVLSKPVVHNDFLLLPYMRKEETEIAIQNNKKKYIVGHFSVNNAVFGSESIMISKKTACIGSLGNFEKAFLGHIHKSQHFLLNDTHVFYMGSIFCNDFAEMNDQKSVIVFDTETEKIEKIKLNNIEFKLIKIDENYIDSFDWSCVKDKICKIIVKNYTGIYTKEKINNIVVNNECNYLFNVIFEQKTRIEQKQVEKQIDIYSYITEYFEKYENTKLPLSYLLKIIKG